MVKRTINQYFVFTALFNFASSFTFVTYVLFLKANGLNYLQINLVNCAFMTSIVILELPTGVFADLFGRRNSLITGCLLFVPANLIYFYSKTFWGFVCAEIMGAIGVTFLSGALDAWLKDSLDYHGYDGNLASLFSKSEIVRNLVIILGSLTGAYVGQFDLALPWLLTSLGAFLSTLFLYLFLQEDYFVKSKISWQNCWQKIKAHTQNSLSFSVKSGLVRLLIGLDFGLMLSFQAPNMFWSLTFQKYLGNTFAIGKFWTLIPILVLLGGYSGGKLAQSFSEKKIISLSVLIIGLGLLFASRLTALYPLVIFFSLHEFGRGMMGPVKRAYINKHIPTKERATILSFDSMISHLGAAIGLIISGILARSFSIPTAWLISSIVVLSLLLVANYLPNGQKS